MKPRATGNAVESLARAHLEAQGLRCLEHNYQTRRGEIDLIMRDGEELVFVEVRFRGNTRYGGSAASITATKRRRLTQAAEHYRLVHPREQHRRCRFDVVAVDGIGPTAQLSWLRAAF